LTIEPGKITPSYQVPAAYDSLVALNFARTKVKTFEYQLCVTINELDEYVYNRIEFASPWPLIEGMYQSPEIPDNEITIMEARLINSEPAILTFEYNVSSETTYDVFSFSADGVNEISNVSGESGWVSFSMIFDVGTHTLLWVYEKDRSRAVGRDNVQLREISVE
jgi:hypothetical protein